MKAHLPYVRRREYGSSPERHERWSLPHHRRTRGERKRRSLVLKTPEPSLAGEICCFATFAPTPGELNRMCARHVEALAHAGFAVVLVANTDLDRRSLRSNAALLDRWPAASCARTSASTSPPGGTLTGLGQGSPVHATAAGQRQRDRPLDERAYATLIERLRASDADMVGLTRIGCRTGTCRATSLPSAATLASEAFRRAFAGMRSLPTKNW